MLIQAHLYSVKIHTDNDITVRHTSSGTLLYDLLNYGDSGMETPCGGNGSCGKCRVIVKGDCDEISNKEKNLLGDALIKGYRLACYTKIISDIEVYIEANKGNVKAKILTAGKTRNTELAPVIAKKYFELKPPDLYDQRSDLERIYDSGMRPGAASNTIFAHSNVSINSELEQLRRLPAVLRKNAFKATGIYLDGELISVESGDTHKRMYGFAVDIGTTTIAAYFVDLVNGRRLGAYSMLNPQNKYGADVISRIDYSGRSIANMYEMRSYIVKCINAIINRFNSLSGIRKKDIYVGVFVGNTAMMHLLMAISTDSIARSPFVPVTTSMHMFKSCELGVNINRAGIAVIFPSVSAFLGADTVAAVLSTGLYENDRLSLLVDIGTNGEIVLGNRNRMIACSTAAGPAFEGAGIRNGMGGVSGAIDSISFKDILEFTTIDGKSATGICGSGIVDAIAGMLEKDIIDFKGRIQSKDEANVLSRYYSERLVEVDESRAFVLLHASETISGEDMVITQKDVREFQNAKAAILSGIKILVRHFGVKVEDIEIVYLAGGFGNYINIDNAFKTGLFPAELKGKVEPVGNAAGNGALEGLISSRLLAESKRIAKDIEYLELSALPEFTGEFVESMIF